MMITAPLFQNVSMLEPVPVRALSSITAQQAEMIEDAVHAVSLGWDVQTIDDYDGYLSIVVQPNAAGSHTTTLLISGTAKCLELSQVQDDKLTALGTFSELGPILARLQTLVRS